MTKLRFRETEQFSAWLSALRDGTGRGNIARRIVRAQQGNFGDVAPVGDGVSEMRVHIGPGYRVYFAREGSIVYVLLCGGDKKTQAQDIAQAKSIWAEIKRNNDANPA